jgi:integrase
MKSDLAIATLIQSRMTELGLSRGEFAKRLGYKNVAKGIRRIDVLCDGDLEGTKHFLDVLPQALETSAETVKLALEQTVRELELAEKQEAEAHDKIWRENFCPHAIILTERTVPSPIFVAAMIGVEKLLRIDLDATQGPVSFVKQVLYRLPEGVPAFGKTIGFVINYSPTYQAALSGGANLPAVVTSPGRGTVAAAVSLYLGTMTFGALAEATQRRRRTVLARFRKEHGDKPLALLQRKHVQKILDEKAGNPHGAKGLLKALRGVATAAVAAGLIDEDPTNGIRIKIPKTGGFKMWGEPEIEQFENYWPVGTRERLAFALLLYSGQRRGDILRIGRQHIREGILTVRPELAAILEAPGPGNLTFLTTRSGAPFSPEHFTTWFGNACRAAGLPLGYSAHALRKAMCRRLAEAGCSAPQIAAISGHLTLAEVQRYIEGANKKRMARDAMRSITRTTIGEPSRKVRQFKS